jgi:hypothetical protein
MICVHFFFNPPPTIQNLSGIGLHNWTWAKSPTPDGADYRGYTL